MAAEIEIELSGVADADINRCTGRYVAALPAPVFAVTTKEPGMVALLHDDEGDAGLVTHFQHRARLADRPQLSREHLEKRRKNTAGYAAITQVEPTSSGITCSTHMQAYPNRHLYQSECLGQWLSTWDTQRGHETFLEGLRVDFSCTRLSYICFIRVLDGGRWVMVGCYNGSRYKKG